MIVSVKTKQISAEQLREEIAEVVHNSQFCEAFNELPLDGVERALYLGVADALLSKYMIFPRDKQPS